jgi:tetratricopeptide (TPR) repeat protein
MTTPPEPLTVFISYAHEDKDLFEKLINGLSLLQRQGIIGVPWYDRHISGGRKWSDEIERNLEEANIILLLVSHDFLASDYCYKIELPRALERHAENKARVIPINLRPAEWKDAPFGEFQRFPTGEQAVTQWSNPDEAFREIAVGVRKVAEELRGSTASRPLPFIPPIPFSRRQRTTLLVFFLASVALIIGFCLWQSHQHLTHGNQLIDIGLYAEARNAFQSAWSFNPLSSAAALGIEKTALVEMKSDLVRFEQQAQRLYQKAPHDPHVNMFMGDLALRLDDREKALGFYKKAVELRPELAEAHFAPGRLYDQDGNRDKAKSEYEKASRISSTTPKYRNNLADLLFREGNYDEAIKQYGVNNEYPLSALEIGKIYWAKGDIAQARDQQRQAIVWLEDENIVTKPWNQGPWEFEISRNQGVRLSTVREKHCYAHYTLSVSSYLLGEEADAESHGKKAQELCPTAENDLKAIVGYDLARVKEVNGKYAARITAYRQRFLE